MNKGPDHPYNKTLCKAWMGACGLRAWRDGLCEGHYFDLLHNPHPSKSKEQPDDLS